MLGKAVLVETVLVVHPETEHRIRINQSDVPTWQAKGYEEAQPVEAVEETEDVDVDTQPKDLKDMTLSELRKRAASIGVLNADKLGSSKLIQAITAIEGDSVD